jgi:hypothetical protein
VEEGMGESAVFWLEPLIFTALLEAVELEDMEVVSIDEPEVEFGWVLVSVALRVVGVGFM